MLVLVFMIVWANGEENESTEIWSFKLLWPYFWDQKCF